MYSYQINIIPKWLIKNHNLYFIDNKNILRNVNNGKVVKMQLKGYTKGYYLNGKFYSLDKLDSITYEYREDKSLI